MKTIGLIGGMTWYSTQEYYRYLNEIVHARLGNSHGAKVIINSVDFNEIKRSTEQDDWEAIAGILVAAARSIELAGADCILIAANTMHKVADVVQASVNIPLIDITDVVAAEIKSKHLQTVALLGTKYTMQLDFYKNKLSKKEITVLVPGEEAISFINNTIYTEFSKGLFLPETKQNYLRIIDTLIDKGAEGIILGCTEIPLLIKQTDCTIPLFDTALIHCKAAVDFAFEIIIST